GVGILVTVLLDAEIAVVVTAVVAVIAGAVNGPSLELGTHVLLGGLAGILAIRRGDRLATFIEAGAAVFVAQALVVTAFSLLAERAAEVIGADPLITRVAAYYHDIGKLANPAAFIENQAGGENVHDQLTPEESAQILKQHVADGIDLAYQSKLPKPLIAFIPQ